MLKLYCRSLLFKMNTLLMNILALSRVVSKPKKRQQKFQVFFVIALLHVALQNRVLLYRLTTKSVSGQQCIFFLSRNKYLTVMSLFVSTNRQKKWCGQEISLDAVDSVTFFFAKKGGWRWNHNAPEKGFISWFHATTFPKASISMQSVNENQSLKIANNKAWRVKALQCLHCNKIGYFFHVKRSGSV